MNKNTVIFGKSEEVLKTFEDNSIDSIVTDPPAGIDFMSTDWDSNIGVDSEKINVVMSEKRVKYWLDAKYHIMNQGGLF